VLDVFETLAGRLQDAADAARDLVASGARGRRHPINGDRELLHPFRPSAPRRVAALRCKQLLGGLGDALGGRQLTDLLAELLDRPVTCWRLDGF